jgi:xanthine dehydrogenase YagT iron-sulfur-binding subunit
MRRLHRARRWQTHQFVPGARRVARRCRELHPLQVAFIERDAFQCGYCTPGQICSAAGLLTEGHTHNRAEIREHMSGNLCRCGAYTNIADAVADVLMPRIAAKEAAE